MWTVSLPATTDCPQVTLRCPLVDPSLLAHSRDTGRHGARFWVLDAVHFLFHDWFRHSRAKSLRAASRRLHEALLLSFCSGRMEKHGQPIFMVCNWRAGPPLITGLVASTWHNRDGPSPLRPSTLVACRPKTELLSPLGDQLHATLLASVMLRDDGANPALSMFAHAVLRLNLLGGKFESNRASYWQAIFAAHQAHGLARASGLPELPLEIFPCVGRRSGSGGGTRGGGGILSRWPDFPACARNASAAWVTPPERKPTAAATSSPKSNVGDNLYAALALPRPRMPVNAPWPLDLDRRKNVSSPPPIPMAFLAIDKVEGSIPRPDPCPTRWCATQRIRFGTSRQALVETSFYHRRACTTISPSPDLALGQRCRPLQPHAPRLEGLHNPADAVQLMNENSPTFEQSMIGALFFGHSHSRARPYCGRRRDWISLYQDPWLPRGSAGPPIRKTDVQRGRSKSDC